MANNHEITPLGFHNFRGNRDKKFGIKIDDRRRHIYVVGKTGVGKSTLLENMAIADIQSGKGIAIIDPHGEFAERMLDFVPEERLNDVIYFDPSDMEHPFAFNPMEQVGSEFRHLVASGIMSVFKKIWIDAWSARMEYILNNTLLALLEYPDSTLLGILRVFSDPEYRKKIVDNLQDPVIKSFWQKEFARYSQKLETEALAAIQNKVGQFVSNPLLRNILGQSRSTLNMREIMDSGKIFIANLSKGKMGEDNSTLLGAMIITRLQLAAMSRVDVPEEKRRDFFMYVDEFQNFATSSFASILSEARKYHLSLTLAHQYIGQLVSGDGDTKVRDAVFGNVGTIVTFRIGAADAEFLEKEFLPEFTEQDLVNLAKANIYIKLMIDGVASRPFSAETLPPQPTPLVTYRDAIIRNSNEKYGTPRRLVEERIASDWGASADQAVDKKMERRGEQRLSEALRPGAGGMGGNAGAGSGAPSYASQRPPASRAPSFSTRSTGGGGAGGGDSRPPREYREPAREPREFRQERPPAERPYVDRPPVDRAPVDRPRESIRQSEPRPPRKYDNPGRPPDMPPSEPVQAAPDDDFVPLHTLASMKKPTSPSNQQPNQPAEPTRQPEPAEQPIQPKQEAHVPSTKRFPKPSVDIDALRKAIHDSLKKQADSSDAAAEKKPEV